MRFFKRKSKGGGSGQHSDQGSTYYERIHTFWEWFAANHERIYADVDKQGGAGIQPEITAQMEQLDPNFFPWTFGPGTDGGHAFVFTPEGNDIRKLLAARIVAQAPELPGWTWHASKPANPDFASIRIGIGDDSLGPDEIWTTATPDPENKAFHLTVWSPLFAKMPEDAVWQILGLFVDQAFGEERGENVIAGVEIGDGQLADSFPFTELPEHVEKVMAERGWTTQAMVGMAYELEPPIGGFARADIMVGVTSLPDVSLEYLDQGKAIKHPYPKVGLRFDFVRIARGHDVDEHTLQRRYMIEDALEEALGPRGVKTGGATGLGHDYIDLMLLDGEGSAEIVSEVLDAKRVDNWDLLSFTR